MSRRGQICPRCQESPYARLRPLAGAPVGSRGAGLAGRRRGWLLRIRLGCPARSAALGLAWLLAGIGCGLATRDRSQAAGALAGVIALVLSIYIEWKFFPFAADESLGYFLTHLHQASGQTWLMILFGTLAGYWFGCGRRRYAAESSTQDAD